MDYNPLTQEFNRLSGILNRKKEEKRKLYDGLKWFDSNDIGSLFSSLESKENSKRKLLSLIEEIKIEVDILNKKIQETKVHTKSQLNPFNWFDDEQNSFRKKLKELNNELNTKQDYLAMRRKALSGSKDLISKVSADIDKYKTFERQRVVDEIDGLSRELALIGEEFKEVSKLKNNVDAELAPILKQIKNYKSMLSSAKKKISDAESFELDLDLAANSYEKAMIHQECEDDLGEGKPKNIIRKHERIAIKIEKDIGQAEKRVIQIGKKAEQFLMRRLNSKKTNDTSPKNEYSNKNNEPISEPFNKSQQKEKDNTVNIYLDFEKNEDDNEDKHGRVYPGLRSQLENLRRSHGNTLFPDSPPGEDILSTFVDTFFPEGVTQSYFICNISLKADEPLLSIRPQIIGPRLERLLPRGRSLAVFGKLIDNQRDNDNPVFMVRRIVDLSHSEARPFEHSISGLVFSQSQNVYPGFKREENALSSEFIFQLPSISIETKKRLKDWRAYLDWRERLVRARLVGLRYLKVEMLEDGRVRFLTACESKSSFDQVRKTLRSDGLNAYDLNYSLDPWQFDYNGRHRGRGTELGDFVSQKDVRKPSDIDTTGMPWDEPYFMYIHFRLPEDAQNEFDGILNGGGAFDDAARQYIKGVHQTGFLTLSVVGDISLIDRQRKELVLLQNESGYAPFLSSYLFNIKAANEPSELKQIGDNQWLQSSLNDDQRLAVRKMISTPDLAMVQGPPGTGKTTMIAEACWQFVQEGKKVLIVSQASLAVNNALERLAKIPAIRAIRLSRRERKNEREHPYSQEHALETYYGSIAIACESRTLDVWTSADERLNGLNDWISSVDLVSSDVNSLRLKTNEMTQQRTALKAELKRLHESDEYARNIEQMRQEVAGFRAFIEGADSFSGTIPDQLLRIVYDRIILALNRLTEVGIRANKLWIQFEYGSALERTHFTVDALLNWRKVIAFKAQINGDRERLKTTEGDTVLSPESAIRLAELQRNLEATEKAMIEDASKVSEWRALQKEIREVKRQGAGLDRGTYARLFNVSENKSLPVLTDPGSTRARVIDVLDQTYALISEIESMIEHGLDDLHKELDSFVGNLPGVEVDIDELRRIEGELRHLMERQKEASFELSDKEKRLKDILQKQPGKKPSVILELADLPELRKTAESERSSLSATLDQSRAFRETWGDLIQQWASDLRNSETIKCDQDNFFSNYINACNVVGVTCTENRRTLEDAGHTWFDAVIVDEVSKATPTEIIMPLMMGRTAILVGDHRQLPPLFKEQEGSWEEAIADQEESSDEDQNTDSELNAENFERFKKMVTSSLFKEHFENGPDSLKSFLFTQYRMHPQIMRVVNQFYENRLQCGLSDPDGQVPGSDPGGHRIHGLTLNGEKSQQYVVPERHVAWLDSTLDPHHKPHHERRDLGTSKVNELECILIARALCDIEMSCREQGFGSKGKPRKQVGVITFYGRQVRAIREAINRIQSTRKIHFNAIEYDINTVDRYQGQERPIIIVSMVRNPTFKLSQRANTAQFERINVAFSRAQELLIVAGAKDVFCQYPVFLPHLDRPGKRKVEVYRHIIDEIQRNGGLWSSDYIVSAHEYDGLLPKGFPRQSSNHRFNQKNNHRKGKSRL